MKTLISLEYLKAFSMLYIVGYWHLFDYTDSFPNYSNNLTCSLTVIILGLFVLISGFLVGTSAKNSVRALDFYKKRMFRIYPLYALAVIIFYIFHMNDLETSIKSLFFITMYVGPSPATLWYITMLFLFYLLTPLLVRWVNKPAKFFGFTLFILGITFLLLVVGFESVDYRLLLYFPSFCMGVYCSYYGVTNKVVNYKSALFLFFIWLCTFFINIDSEILIQLKSTPLIISVSYLMFLISYINEKHFKKIKIISLLSYSSYAMYLFHRPIYSSLIRLYFPEKGELQILYLMFFCLIVIFTFSWFMQKFYDSINCSKRTVVKC